MGAFNDIFLQSDFQTKERPHEWEIEGITVICKQSDYLMVEQILQSLNKIPTGREALDEMKKHETPFKLADDLGKSVGCYTPSQNIITLNKKCGIDKLRSCLVHEARHLWQDHVGRGEYESQHLDYETNQMIYRATEADAQSQAYKACNEWAELGDTAPRDAFAGTYTQIADGWEKDGVAGAYRGWYDDERITAAYENGYDVESVISCLGQNSYEKGPLVHGTPKDIKAFCGGDKVPDFEQFVLTPKAKQIHNLTQAFLEIYNAGAVCYGQDNDDTVAQMPLRDLKNKNDHFYADKYITETRQDISKKCSFATNDKPIYYSILKTIDAVEQINQSAIKGEKNPQAEQTLQDEKLYLFMAKKIRMGFNPEIVDKVELPKSISDRLKVDSAKLYTSTVDIPLSNDMIKSVQQGIKKLNLKASDNSAEQKTTAHPTSALLAVKTKQSGR